MIKYKPPKNWISYDAGPLLFNLLTDAKASVQSLKTIPLQKDWVEKLQKVQLKREVAGTSRIEGADFTDNELEKALGESPEELFTRSQKQAHAAKNTYLWIAKLTDKRPIGKKLILDVHRRIVTGADDDHCKPGALRSKDQNVSFGAPSHRGAEGGAECEEIFNRLIQAVQREFQEHDPLIQALALHYHFAAIHPFMDGNGRTARALEALMLQRVGLRDAAFIAMSNHYYEEKEKYLGALAQTQAGRHDLTPFLIFGLRGINTQCKQLFEEINKNVSKALYRSLMFDLFNRLQTKRKRVIARRQLEILKILLDRETIQLEGLFLMLCSEKYSALKNPLKAFLRDLRQLVHIGAIKVKTIPGPNIKVEGKNFRVKELLMLEINLAWSAEISASDFMEKIEELPLAKSHPLI